MCGVDYGDYDWFQLVWTVKRARKRYPCEACEHRIAPGELYRYSKGLYDGTFYVQRRCLRCDLIADAMDKRGCDVNFAMMDAWEETPIETMNEGSLVPDTEPVCALVFLTQAELEARV